MAGDNIVSPSGCPVAGEIERRLRRGDKKINKFCFLDDELLYMGAPMIKPMPMSLAIAPHCQVEADASDRWYRKIEGACQRAVMGLAV